MDVSSPPLPAHLLQGATLGYFHSDAIFPNSTPFLRTVNVASSHSVQVVRLCRRTHDDRRRRRPPPPPSPPTRLDQRRPQPLPALPPSTYLTNPSACLAKLPPTDLPAAAQTIRSPLRTCHHRLRPHLRRTPCSPTVCLPSSQYPSSSTMSGNRNYDFLVRFHALGPPAPGATSLATPCAV